MWKHNRLLILLIICAIVLAGCSVNGQTVSLQVFLSNLQNSYNRIEKMVSGFAYLMGGAMEAYAIFQLKIYGESRTMMSGHANLFKPLIYMFVGAVLMYLPSAMQAVLMSTFGSSQLTPLNYSGNDTVTGTLFGQSVSVTLTPAFLGLVQIVGLISFIRGWVFITRIADQGQHGNLGKGLTHIFGGILAMNIVATKNILFNLVTTGGG